MDPLFLSSLFTFVYPILVYILLIPMHAQLVSSFLVPTYNQIHTTYTVIRCPPGYGYNPVPLTKTKTFTRIIREQFTCTSTLTSWKTKTDKVSVTVLKPLTIIKTVYSYSSLAPRYLYVTETETEAKTTTETGTVEKIVTKTETRTEAKTTTETGTIEKIVTKTETQTEMDTIRQTLIMTEISTASGAVITIQQTLIMTQTEGKTVENVTMVASHVTVPSTATVATYSPGTITKTTPIPVLSSTLSQSQDTGSIPKTTSTCNALSNAILNPSFEVPSPSNLQTPASWSLYTPPGSSNIQDNYVLLIRSNTLQPSYDGSYYLRIHISPSMPSDTFINFSQLSIVICPNTKYSLTAWTRRDSVESECVATFYLGDVEVMSSADDMPQNVWVKSQGYWVSGTGQGTVDLRVKVVCGGLAGVSSRMMRVDGFGLSPVALS